MLTRRGLFQLFAAAGTSFLRPAQAADFFKRRPDFIKREVRVLAERNFRMPFKQTFGGRFGSLYQGAAPIQRSMNDLTNLAIETALPVRPFPPIARRDFF